MVEEREVGDGGWEGRFGTLLKSSLYTLTLVLSITTCSWLAAKRTWTLHTCTCSHCFCLFFLVRSGGGGGGGGGPSPSCTFQEKHSTCESLWLLIVCSNKKSSHKTTWNRGYGGGGYSHVEITGVPVIQQQQQKQQQELYFPRSAH